MIGVNPSRTELTFFNLFKKEQTTSLREVYWIVAATISQVLVLNQTALFFRCSSHKKPMCLCTSCHLKQTCLHLLWPSAPEAGRFSPFPSLLSTPDTHTGCRVNSEKTQWKASNKFLLPHRPQTSVFLCFTYSLKVTMIHQRILAYGISHERSYWWFFHSLILGWLQSVLTGTSTWVCRTV